MALNYDHWKQEHTSVLKTLAKKKVYMLFTGGKDSSVTLWLLLKASKEFGFSFETSTARYPLQVFPDDEVDKLDTFWRTQGVEVVWHEVDASDDLLSESEFGGGNPCSICQTIKSTYLFNYFTKLKPQPVDIVLILSFSLWDLVSYSIEYLVEGIYSKERTSGYNARALRTSQRFYPLIQFKDGLTVFKPLIKYNNQEILRVAAQNHLPLSKIECPYKQHSPKRILFNYYQQTDAFFDYNKVLSYAKNSFNIHELGDGHGMDDLDFVKAIL